MQITSAFALEIAPSTTVKSICRWRKSVRLGFGSDSEDILTAGAISIPRMLNPWVRKWPTKLNRGLSIRRRPNAIFAVKNVSFMEFMTAVTYCPSTTSHYQFQHSAAMPEHAKNNDRCRCVLTVIRLAIGSVRTGYGEICTILLRQRLPKHD